jgi:Domain of unknown function (DUF4129)
MSPRFAVALLAVALLLPAAARAGQPPAADLDAPAFVAMLQQLADQVRATDAPAGAAMLAHDLPPAWTVRVGDQRLTVPAAPIVDALTSTSTPESSWPRRRAAAVGKIDALREEASPLARVGAPLRPHLRGALAEVLAAPEFRGRQRYAGLMAFVDRVKSWLRSWLPDVTPGTAVVVPLLRYATWVIAAIAFLLLAWVTWRLLRGASRDTAARPRPVRGADPVDARRWAVRARAAAAAGDAREAVRCAYHAVLHRLDEDGAWTIAEARTPREYMRLLPAADRRQPAVSFVARLFEGTWYGGAEPALDDARTAVRHLKELGCDAQADPAI